MELHERLSKRVRLCCDNCEGLNLSWIAEELLNIPLSTLSRYLSGEREIPPHIATQLIKFVDEMITPEEAADETSDTMVIRYKTMADLEPMKDIAERYYAARKVTPKQAPASFGLSSRKASDPR